MLFFMINWIKINFQCVIHSHNFFSNFIFHKISFPFFKKVTRNCFLHTSALICYFYFVLVTSNISLLHPALFSSFLFLFLRFCCWHFYYTTVQNCFLSFLLFCFLFYIILRHNELFSVSMTHFKSIHSFWYTFIHSFIDPFIEVTFSFFIFPHFYSFFSLFLFFLFIYSCILITTSKVISNTNKTPKSPLNHP